MSIDPCHVEHMGDLLLCHVASEDWGGWEDLALLHHGASSPRAGLLVGALEVDASGAYTGRSWSGVVVREEREGWWLLRRARVHEVMRDRYQGRF